MCTLLRALVSPAPASPEERRTYGQGVLRQAALTYAAALRRYQPFCHHWQDEQPGLVATLERDFLDTLMFYPFGNRHRLWSVPYLRTTSLLERTNAHGSPLVQRRGLPLT